MLARLYQPADAPAVDAILNGTGHVLLERDRLVVLGVPGSPRNLLVWRPGCIVHELRLSNGLGQRQRADNLVQCGMTDALSRPFQLWEAAFVTNNDTMAAYARDLGAIEESGKRLFTLRLR